MHRQATYLTALLLTGCAEPADEPSLGLTRQSLVDQSAVLGFEDVADWTVTQGAKSASVERTEGAQALAITGFTYTELRSPTLSSLTGVTSTLAFDLRAPSPVDWGQAQLFVSIPSRGVYHAWVGGVALAGTAAGTYRPVSFELSSALRAALSQTYTDLTFVIALNVPQRTEPYLVDNLRFVGASAPSSVALSVSNVDDFVYVTVNGVRRLVVPWHRDISVDASSWFAGGLNDVRVQAVNTGGPSSLSAQLTVDGQLVLDARCDALPCSPDLAPGVGILFDRRDQISTPGRPAPVSLRVDGVPGAKIYLDDAYTGRSVPADFSLPPGSYTVGVGVGDDGPGSREARYHEQRVQLGTSPVTITPTASAPLAPNHTRIAILPIRRTLHGGEGPTHTGVLSDRDIAVFHGQALATRDTWVEPFSYGLTTWDIDLLPTVEDIPIHRTADPLSVPDGDRLLREAGLTHLPQQYDSVVYFFSEHTEGGALVEHTMCCFWGGGQFVWFPNKTTRGTATEDDPNVFLLHEVLHDYEGYNGSRLGFYNGAGGLHGANTHGYHHGDGGETDLLKYYRRYMRNQVAEVRTMRDGVDFTAPLPETADLWIGVFDTMRRDVSWQAPQRAGARSVESATSSASLPTCGLRP